MAKGKKTFGIKTPGNSSFVKNSASGRTSGKLMWDSNFANRINGAFGEAQEFVDSECIRRMNPETPRRTGMLIKSATLGTVIGSGEINQTTPYARRQYYEHKEKSHWFERMKNRHKDSILKGAAKYVKSH